MNLRKISEDATTITLGWDLPPADVNGYRFSREKGGGKYSHTWDGMRTSARFSKDSAWYLVEPLVAMMNLRGVYPPVEPPPPPTTGLPKFGVATGYTILNRNDADRNYELDQIKAVGAGVVRFDSTPGNQGQVDRVVAGCAARGLKAILALYGTTGPRTDFQFAGSQAAKFKGNATIAGLEICNEPDLHGWTASMYAAFFCDCAGAARAVDPASQMIFGALWKGSGTAPLDFTAALINELARRQPTAKPSYVSLHLYDNPAEHGGWQIWDMAYPRPGGSYNGRTVREKLDAAGLSNVPIISTESGGPLTWDGQPRYTKEQQAQIVSNALNEAKAGKVACVCIYSMLDDDVPGFGMLDGNRQKRPSWDAYKAAAT